MNFNKVQKYTVMLLFLAIALPSFSMAAADTLDIPVFVGETCPHCAELEEYFSELSQEYDYINPIYYEVWYNESNRDLFNQISSEYGIKAQGVPTTFIGDEYLVGYSSEMNQDIIRMIESTALDRGIIENKEENNSTGGFIDQENNKNSVKLPFFGEVSSESVSLPVLTLLLGFLDGFNPCAFFVLLFLLSMLVYAKSRKRMLIIGLTFVFFSGLIYFLFMSAWLNFFMITKNISIITSIAGLTALVIAAINIKDFFAFKKGVSLSVSDKNRKTLISKMRGLLKADSMVSMIIGTIALAITANLYELLCTAGFPMVFTKVLVLNELSTFSYYMYLLFYNVVYVIPLLTIVIIFTYTFGAKKLSKSQGEALKLLSGMMMLSLGGLLLFKPGLLNNLFAAVGTILLALIATAVILIVKKYLLRENGDKK